MLNFGSLPFITFITSTEISLSLILFALVSEIATGDVMVSVALESPAKTATCSSWVNG